MRNAFQSTKAIQGAAPISTLVEHQGIVYLSGVTALDPVTNELKGDTVQQAEKSLCILKELLESYGIGMEDVLKVNIYLVDMEDFQQVNQVYAPYFTAPYPARTCVQVAKLPMDARIEIEAVAAK